MLCGESRLVAGVLFISPVPLTGCQVEDDADGGRVIDDIGAFVQVVHVIAAVVATVTKHQIQHQVLQEKDHSRGRSTP